MPQVVSEAVLRAVAGEALQAEDVPRWVALAARPEWEGSPTLDVDGRSVRVLPCVSVLALREALTDRSAEGEADLTILLTDRSDRELGEEALARLWRNRVRSPTGWEQAKQLFKADTLDPALADERWLVDLLVQVAPTRGYPPLKNAYLSRDEAWRALLKHGLRVSAEDPTTADLVRWAGTESAAQAFAGPMAGCANEIVAAFRERIGSAAALVVRLVAAGRGLEVAAGGLVADALWAGTSGDEVARAAARTALKWRLELAELPDGVGREWGKAAVEALDHVDRRGQAEVAQGWIEKAEDILHELEAVELAGGSDVLRMGFDARLMEFGAATRKFLKKPGEGALAGMVGAFNRVEAHRRAGGGEGRDRGERAEMAVRLCRRMLRGEPDPASDLPTVADRFREDGAWVDRARDALAEGETVGGLAAAYAELLEQVDAVRGDRDRRFGHALAAWAPLVPGPDSPVRPIERVLGEVVAPLGREHPVLLLVLDGLSYAESLRLHQDLRDLGWKSHTPGGRALPPVVAAFPTVTQVSRVALLTGTLKEGGQKQEREGFEQHEGLRSVSPKKPPVLFHKKDLKVSAGQIAPEVRDAILDPERRVVGAVVNAVDDHLDKGAQLRLADGLRALKPLRPLLETASEASRIVVVVSDHGHILERGSTVRPRPGAGERWRPADPGPEEDEVLLEGGRVVKGDGRIVAPVVDTIRYIAPEKRGYHGGATPQEVLCPLMVLFPGGVSVDGWEGFIVREPVWWSGAKPDKAEVSWEPVSTAVEPSGQATFLDSEGRIPAASTGPAWIGALMSSPLWEEQRGSGGRAQMDDDVAARMLEVLDRAGGTASAHALAGALDVPATRVRGKLAALQQVVNIDGYAVLTIEPDGTGRLNRELLLTQFGVDG